jgi:hypothetical protein
METEAMYFTHHFAHQETLNRARSWLTELGFRPEQVESRTTGFPRLSIRIARQQLAEIELLLHAIERSDPDGSPSFWYAPTGAWRPSRDEEASGSPAPTKAHSFAIGWHPPDHVYARHADRHEIFSEPA